MAKKDNVLIWIISAVLCLPLAIIWLILFLCKEVASLGRAEKVGRRAVGTATKASGNRTTASRRKQRNSEDGLNSVKYNVPLYEALRLPGDPDPDFSGNENNDSWDFETNFTATDEFVFEEEEEVFHHSLFSGLGEDEYKKQDDGYEDDLDYSWETHCEFCGELLEDCVCDHKHESHEAIGLWDCGCEEEDGLGLAETDNKKDGLLDFDEFRSF